LAPVIEIFTFGDSKAKSQSSNTIDQNTRKYFISLVPNNMATDYRTHFKKKTKSAAIKEKYQKANNRL